MNAAVFAGMTFVIDRGRTGKGAAFGEFLGSFGDQVAFTHARQIAHQFKRIGIINGDVIGINNRQGKAAALKQCTGILHIDER